MSDIPESYIEALRTSPYHKEPTLQHIYDLCPHLPTQVVDDHYAMVAGGGSSWYFDTPGIRVQGATHHVGLLHVKDRGLVLMGSGGANELVNPGRSPAYGHQLALEWQQQHVPEDTLICPTIVDNQGGTIPRWVWFQECPVQDPGKHQRAVYRNGDFKGYEPCEYRDRTQDYVKPVTVTGLAYAYRIGPNTFHNNPIWQQTVEWDAVEQCADQIIHSSDVILWNEVKAANRHQGACPTFYCARCGRALGLTGCSGCQLYFPDDQFRTGGGACIGPKAQALLEQHGHTFIVDPQVRRDAETQLHAELMQDRKMKALYGR